MLFRSPGYQTFRRYVTLRLEELLDGLLAARKVGPLYIAPGSPWENGYSESFNSRMKAEFADREMFASLLEAKVLGAEYQRYWNQERLHSGIGYKTPAEFAAELGPDSATLRPPQVRSKHQPTLISTGT